MKNQTHKRKKTISLREQAINAIMQLRTLQLKKRKERIPPRRTLRRWAAAHFKDYFDGRG